MIYLVTRKKTYALLWLIPVLLVPLLWPLHATLSGDLDDWINGVRYQVSRDRPLINTLNTFYQIDPVLFVLGMGGLVYAAIRKDYFVLLWAIPVFIFLQAIGYVSSFHIILLLPPICIAGANMIEKIGSNISNIKTKNMLPYIRVAVIAIFGICSITQAHEKHHSNCDSDACPNNFLHGITSFHSDSKVLYPVHYSLSHCSPAT